MPTGPGALHPRSYPPHFQPPSERLPGQIKEIASFASTFFLDATRLMISKFRRGEDLKSWYVENIRERYLFITSSASRP
jgi:hypothetical protein